MHNRRRSQFERLEPRSLLATATVNWNDARQTIDGFGASSAWSSGTYPASAVSLLFSPTNGIGLSLLRNRVAPSMTTTETSIMQQVQQLGARVWSTPWSPPKEWKTTNSNGNGGSLKPEFYQAYATGLATYVLNQKAAGVDLYALSLQNEPDWTADWETCIWNADQFAAFLPVVASTFAARGVTTKIMLAEQAAWNFSLLSKIAADPSLMQYVDIVGAHNYNPVGNPYKAVPLAGGKRLWVTEQSADPNSSAMAGAIPWAVDIYKAFTVAGVNAWHYWWLSAGGSGGVTSSNFTAIKRTWAIGNYSRFVRPGWQFVGTTNDSTLNISTFKDPVSGKFAIVAVNAGSSAVSQTFNFTGFTAVSVTPYVTSDTAGDDLAAKASIATTNAGARFIASVGANSVVTYVGQLSSAAALQAPQNLAVRIVQGNGKSQLAISWDDVSTGETAYAVERSLDGTTWTPLTSTLAANAQSYTDTGLAENTAYQYRVRATNGASASPYTLASGRTLLGAPYNLGIGTTAIGTTVGWLDGTTGETKLTIDRSLDGLVWTTVASNLAPGTTYFVDNSIAGFNPNQIYLYRVRAAAGSVWSTYASASTGLKAPTSLAATSTSTSIQASWTNVAVSAGGVYLEYSDDAGTTWKTVANNWTASTNTYTFVGLTENSTRRLRVRATTQADDVASAYSGVVDAKTLLNSPTSLTATVLGPTQVRLNWVDASAFESGYQVERSADGGASWTLLTTTLAAGATTFTDALAPRGASLTYRVAATATSNASAGVTVTAVTPSVAAPTNLVITPLDTSRLSVTWVANDPSATGSKLEYSTDNATWTVLAIASSATNYTLTDLLGSTRYYVRVRTTVNASESAAAVASAFTSSATTLGSGIDIGGPLPAGSDSYDASTQTYTVSAGGANIWGNADEFRMLAAPLSGDGSIVARLVSQQATDPWAKAGVMLRASTSAGAINAAVLVTPANGITFSYRSTQGGATIRPTPLPAGAAPAWVRVARSGSTLTGYYSTATVAPRPQDWIAFASVDIPALPATLQAGLAVTSRVSGTASTCVFSNVGVYAAPIVTALSFAPERNRFVDVVLDQRVIAASAVPQALSVLNVTTSETFVPESATLQSDGRTIRFSLPIGLTDGNYRFSTSPLLLGPAGDAAASFVRADSGTFILAGDANRDRVVNFDDLLILASKYNSTAADLVFSDGDFNYDGLVNFDDLLILASRYNATLAAQTPSPSLGALSLGPPLPASGMPTPVAVGPARQSPPRRRLAPEIL